MSKADKYRANADLCQRMAARLTRQTDKAQWLYLASQWLDLLGSELDRSDDAKGHRSIQQRQPQALH